MRRGRRWSSCRSRARAGDLIEELQAWLGPEDAGRLRLYPQRDILPYERAADDPWDAKARLEVTAALASGDTAHRRRGDRGGGAAHVSPEAARAAFSSVSVGDRLTPDALLQTAAYRRALRSCRWSRRRGRWRGAAASSTSYRRRTRTPARIEFFGPEVESIRRFEVVTQRSTERVETLELGMAAEFSPDAALAAELLKTLDFSALDEEHDGEVQEELRAIADGETVDARSFLPALLSHHSLLDHLPDDAIVILDEPADLARALDEYVAETATMRLEREARGQLPIGLPPAQANWIDLQPRFSGAGHGRAAALRHRGSRRAASRPSRRRRASAGASACWRATCSEGRAQGRERRHRLAAVVTPAHAAAGRRAAASARSPTIAEAPRPGAVQLVHGSLPHGWHLHHGDADLVAAHRRRGLRLRQAAARASRSPAPTASTSSPTCAGRLRRAHRARHRALRRPDRAQRRGRRARVPASWTTPRATSSSCRSSRPTASRATSARASSSPT